MKVYGVEKDFFGFLTFDDLSVTQGQGQKCQIFTF